MKRRTFMQIASAAAVMAGVAPLELVNQPQTEYVLMRGLYRTADGRLIEISEDHPLVLQDGHMEQDLWPAKSLLRVTATTPDDHKIQILRGCIQRGEMTIANGVFGL